MPNRSATSSNRERRRALLAFASASLVAVACGAATLAAKGHPVASWSRNPVAWLVGVVLATGLIFCGGSLRIARVLLGAAAIAVAGTFLAPAQEGVHRWIDAGPLHVNVAALLLPPAVVALSFCGIWSRTGLVFAGAIAALLALQPDASQATSFLIAAVVLVATSTAPRARRLSAIAAAFLFAAVTWSRPDPLQPVPEVEGIFPLAFAVSPVLAAAAAIGVAAASFAPLALRNAAGGAHRGAALALTAYFISAAVCPAFGAFPVPLVGLGMSFPVGYWVAIALLCAHGSSWQNGGAENRS